MRTVEQRKKAFVRMGKRISSAVNPSGDILDKRIKRAVEQAHDRNKWFTVPDICTALWAIAKKLEAKELNKWLKPYLPALEHRKDPREIAVIAAGNIPCAGFDDFLCTLMAGHRFRGRLSSADNVLLPMLAELLKEDDPGMCEQIMPFDHHHDSFDAVIASGSDNTLRYFTYQYGSFPHLFRGHRNSIAILDGSENKTDLMLLGKDIFLYYGLGCRSVSKLYVPDGYDFKLFFEAMKAYAHLADADCYMHNYRYYKALYTLNQETVEDNGFLLLKEDAGLASPPAVLFYSHYADKEQIGMPSKQIQCIVSGRDVPFGQAQFPKTGDYADGRDTMRFLLELP